MEEVLIFVPPTLTMEVLTQTTVEDGTQAWHHFGAHLCGPNSPPTTTTTTRTTTQDQQHPGIDNVILDICESNEGEQKNNDYSEINDKMCNNNTSNRKKQFNSNMITKIVAINVCGLRSKLNNGIFDEYAKNFDILCLSETKVGTILDIDLSDTSLNDYHCYIKEKSTDNRHQYGGVHGLCMLVRNNIVKHAELIPDLKSPYVLWVKFCEEAFGVGCIIGSIYLPGENATHKDQDMFDTIYNDIYHIKDKLELPICLIGDMNSRTGKLNDILTFEREVIINSNVTDFAQDFF